MPSASVVVVPAIVSAVVPPFVPIMMAVVMVVTMVTLRRPPVSPICRRWRIAVYGRRIPGNRGRIEMPPAPDHVDAEPDRRFGVSGLCHGSKGQAGQECGRKKASVQHVS